MFALLWMILMLGAFYWLLIRPQRRQMMAHRELMATLAVGDEVLTAGGIFGRITSIEDEVVIIEVAPGTSLRLARTAVSRKILPEPYDVPEVEA
ncbi:MAG: preprotein translocase subunit YajC [Acidimicrobiia bacterium]